jgi:cysteine-rich repeat protein
MKTRHLLGALVMSASLLFLSACGDDNDEGLAPVPPTNTSAPTNTATARPTDTRPPATSTPTNTPPTGVNTPTPTATRPDGVPARCGNNSVESGEDCDDGDNFGGDGCAANCTDETRRPSTLAEGSGAFAQLQIFGIPIALSGNQAVVTGQPRDEEVMDADGNVIFRPGEIPSVQRAQDIDLDPVVVSGLFCVCVIGAEMPDVFGPGNSGAGVIGCGPNGLPGESYELVQNHNTGQSEAECTAAGGTVEIPNVTCAPPPAPCHPGACNSAPMRTFTPGGRGAATLTVASELVLLPDSGTCSVQPNQNGKGPDGIPCTEDDTLSGEVSVIVLTTGTARIRDLNANNQPGVEIGPGQMCGFGQTCMTEIEGTRLDCDALAANPTGGTSGSALAGGFVSFDSANGDIVTTNIFIAE